MSHVEFKKWPCRRVEFSSPDPLVPALYVMHNTIFLYQCQVGRL